MAESQEYHLVRQSGRLANLGHLVTEVGRLLKPVGNIPPAEAEERYHAMLEEPALAA